MTAPDSAAVYVRHSTVDTRQALDRSMEGQEHECQEKAKALGLDVVEVFAEREGTSASHLSKKARPEFEAALEGLRRGEFKTLVVYALDRATRQGMGAAGAMLDLCDEADARIISVRDNLDSSLPDARLRVAIMSEMARAEVAILGERVAWGRANARRLRKAHGRTPCFGWRTKDHEVPEGESPYEVVPEEADAIRRSIGWVIDGATLGEAAQMLKDEGFASRSGKPITTAYLSVLYRSPQMLGHLAHTPKGGTAEVILDDDGHPFFWTEPILDEATVARYERVMGARNGGGKPGRKPGAANPTPRSLLTSVLYCEACEGGKLHAQYQKGSVASNYYRCSDRCRPATAIPLDDADAWVTNAVLRRLAALDRNDSPILDFIASHWVERSGTATPVSEVEDEIEVVSAALAKVQREFYAQVGRDSFMDDETYASITADLTRRLDEATVLLREARLATVDAGDVFADFLPSAGSTDGNPAESESWLSLPLHKRRQLINMVVDRITVSPQEPYKVRPGWERRVSIEWVREDRVEDFFTRFSAVNSARIFKA